MMQQDYKFIQDLSSQFSGVGMHFSQREVLQEDLERSSLIESTNDLLFLAEVAACNRKGGNLNFCVGFIDPTTLKTTSYFLHYAVQFSGAKKTESFGCFITLPKNTLSVVSASLSTLLRMEICEMGTVITAEKKEERRSTKYTGRILDQSLGYNQMQWQVLKTIKELLDGYFGLPKD